MKKIVAQISMIVSGVLLMSTLSAQTTSVNENKNQVNQPADSKSLPEKTSESTPVLSNEKKQTTNKTSVGTKAGRNCTANKSADPFAISRKDFDKLPADRKEFILTHSDKYTIKD